MTNFIILLKKFSNTSFNIIIYVKFMKTVFKITNPCYILF